MRCQATRTDDLKWEEWDQSGSLDLSASNGGLGHPSVCNAASSAILCLVATAATVFPSEFITWDETVKSL